MLVIKKQKVKLFLPYFIYFIFLFFFNLVFISKGFHYDSISLASWAEGGGFYVSGQQHHILLTLINYLFYSLYSLLFGTGSALVPLTVLECFVGAFGAVIFLVALNTLFENKLLAIFGSLGLTFSMNYWHYSTLLETHIIPTVFLIIAFYFLVAAVKKESLRHIFYTGFFCCLSLLSSGANIVFIPSFVIFIICTKSLSSDKRAQYILAYINTILLCWLIPFIIAGGLLYFIKNYQNTSFLGAIKFYYWGFKGQLYFADFRVSDLLLLLRNTVSSIFIFQDIFVIVVLFYAAAIFLSIKKIKVLFGEYPNVTFFSLTAAAYFLTTLLFYEPYNLQRYTPLLIFIWLIICLWVKDILSKDSPVYKKMVVFLFMPLLLMNNLILFIAPQHLEKNNFYLNEALLLKEISGKQDVIITAGGEREPSPEMVYIPYFAERKNLITIKALTEKVPVWRFQQAVLLKFQESIESALNNGYSVFILKDAFVLDTKNAENIPPFYPVVINFLKSRYCIREYATRGDVTIYKLTKTELK